MLQYIKQALRKLIPKYYHKPLASMLQIAREVRGYLNYLFYIGDQFHCPCCGKSFRKFLPFDKKAPTIRCCPRCGSHDRHRLLWLYLVNKTTLLSQQTKILHFAPEYFLTKQLYQYPQIDYISADLCSLLAMVTVDITDIPYKDNLFDVILCSHVLEHVENDRQAMQELFRVLKPKGWAILLVPIDHTREETWEDPTITSPEDRLHYYGEPDHVRYYGLDFKNRLEQVGFKVVVEYYSRELDAALIKKYGLTPQEAIYFCEKI